MAKTPEKSEKKKKKKREKAKETKGKAKKERKKTSKKPKTVVISPFFASSAEKIIQSEAEKGNTVKVVIWRRNPRRKSQRGKPGCLKAAEKFQDAYRKVSEDNKWVPPFSEHDLLQEFHFFDHWRVLVICMLLNRTTGRQVSRVLPRLFLLCPDAESTIKVSEKEIEEIIRPLGLQNKRSKMIKRMSEEYLSPDWTHVTQLHGIGKYAADAYAIFCSGKWKHVTPDDHKLVDYWRFLMEDFDARTSITVKEPLPSEETR